MHEPESIRVAVQGGTPALRAGLAALLDSHGGFHVLEADADHAEADVVLAAGAAAARSAAGVPIVAVVDGAAEARELLGLEAVVAAIPGDADGAQVAAAVIAAAAGLLALSPSFGLLGDAVSAANAGQAIAEGGGDLSPRELDVLTLIADGLPNKAIASRLGISENTVKFHAGSILGKLGAASRAEAVMLAARRGLLTI